MINNNTEYSSTPAIYTTELRNPDTNGAFYVTAHASSPSMELASFKLDISTSAGNFTIPQFGGDIILNGRESKIIVTDFRMGNETLVYSTAEVLTVSIQDGLPLMFLWLPAGESGEFFLTGASAGNILKREGCSEVSFNQLHGGVIASYKQLQGSCVITFDNNLRFVLLDRAAAYSTWVPSLSSDPSTPENSTGKSLESGTRVLA